MSFLQTLKQGFLNLTNWGVYEATRPNRNRAIPFYPWGGDPRKEVSSWDRETLMQQARNLYMNSAECRHIVKSMISLTGTLKPIAQTADPEFNKRATKAFLDRVNNPALFEASGKLDFCSLQNYIEERSIVDGDVLIVFSQEKDLGAGVQIYTAPQIRGNEDGFVDGCKLDKRGRIKKYRIEDFETGAATNISANAAFLYSHTATPLTHRGHSELAAAIPDAADLHELRSYLKASAKLTSSFGIVEEKSADDTRPSQSAFLQRRAGTVIPKDAPEEQPLTIGGVTAVSLGAGRKLSVIADNRPSQNLMAFSKDIARALCFSMGLDPELLLYCNDLSSSGTRLLLAKTAEWVHNRLHIREQLCRRFWQNVISCEILAGRLQPPTSGNPFDVIFVPRNNMTIDVGRIGKLQQELITAGLADADSFTLSTSGMTWQQILERKAQNLAIAKATAEEHGLTLAELLGAAPLEVPEEAPEEAQADEAEDDSTNNK